MQKYWICQDVFFLNSNSRSYLRGLESEFGESTNSIRLELNKFEQAGLLTTEMDGNKKYFRAPTEAISNMNRRDFAAGHFCVAIWADMNFFQNVKILDVHYKTPLKKISNLFNCNFHIVLNIFWSSHFISYMLKETRA